MSGGAGLIFKGSGFYTTDYRSEGYKQAAKKEADGAAPKKDAPAKSEPKPARRRAPEAPPRRARTRLVPGQATVLRPTTDRPPLPMHRAWAGGTVRPRARTWGIWVLWLWLATIELPPR